MATDRVEYVVLGATGHIGSAVAGTLLRARHRVRVVTRSAVSGGTWSARGAATAVLDLLNTAALADALSSSERVRVFALNPPGAVDADPDAAEISTADSIVEALSSASPERVVALSTYGARAGRRIGDLGTLHHFEERLAELVSPVAVIRAGYLYSNWNGAVAGARDEGTLPVMLDPGRELPMVSPADVGKEAARLLTRPVAAQGVIYCEGPKRLRPEDVANAFAAGLGRPVQVRRTLPSHWRNEFLSAGFSPAAADSFTGLNRIVDDELWQLDSEPVRGSITLQTYIAELLETA